MKSAAKWNNWNEDSSSRPTLLQRSAQPSSVRYPFKWWDTPRSGEELRESRRGPLKLRVHYSQSDEHQIGLTQSLEVPGSDSQPGEITIRGCAANMGRHSE